MQVVVASAQHGPPTWARDRVGAGLPAHDAMGSPAALVRFEAFWAKEADAIGFAWSTHMTIDALAVYHFHFEELGIEVGQLHPCTPDGFHIPKSGYVRIPSTVASSRSSPRALPPCQGTARPV